MRILPVGVLCMLALNAHANVIQYFAGISYNNPSELFKVKKGLFLIGSSGSYADLGFNGSVLNFNTLQYASGINHSQTYTAMPYGRLAKRFNEKTVFGLDVTQPFNSHLNWGTYAFTRYANTQNFLTDVDVSPKFSYALGRKWQIGGGLNFNFLVNNEVNFAVPTGQFTSANLVNPTSSFGTGFNAGVTYIINETNFLGFTYYSRIKQNTKGTSTLGPLVNPNLALSFYMPTTMVANYVHIFNPKWLISVTGFRSDWSVNQYVRLFNTAAPPPMSNFVFDMHFGNSYAFIGAVRNQVAKKLGLTLIGMRDGGPEKDNLRTITFPSYAQYFLGLSGDYHFNENTSIELLYGHLISNPSIQNRLVINNTSIPFTTGKVNINVDVIDLKLKIEG
ncbi:OmpP1/FadL family transporter [Legionella maioricensis]|uniref:Outer membrane protein transport protein n=1 Tax=Legionella maioricensis TaxID=2896528 RepID=A0A9X2IB38_9GAMM|nr:outer membrane protein transport protein [Legionella maioricensis]MCL9683916.1 outer membrane protein transport protein [Legionella maioricensis]MCL9688318.1 outer membrane protein transport protein [Legionella maioricensis]